MTQKRKGQRVEYAKITSSVTASIPPIKKITGCDDKGIDVKKTIWPIVWLVKKQYPPSESLGNIFIKIQYVGTDDQMPRTPIEDCKGFCPEPRPDGWIPCDWH
jgi:hypothetical protein